MVTRRDVMAGGTALALSSAFGARLALAQGDDSFEALLAQAEASPGAIEAAQRDREGRIEEFDYHVTKAIAPRNKPSDRKISEDAIKMIVLFEVTSQGRYEQKYQAPVWPKGQSGVTVGLGYDLGYVTPGWLKDDWGGLISDPHLAALGKACGKKGAAAQGMLPQVAQVRIPWAIAEPQFRRNVLPRYVAETLDRLPNAGRLSNDSLGAIVSLVYNRGASFGSSKPRFREMRNIKAHMVNGDYDRIAAEITGMIHLWQDRSGRALPGMEGLILRRKMEAKLFARGLA